MNIFVYDGLLRSIYQGEDIIGKKACDIDTDTLMFFSKEFIGQKVIVLYDNNRSSNFQVRPDYSYSTFREGIISKINPSLIYFEEKTTPIKTDKLIDIIASSNLRSPTEDERYNFIFRFFFEHRGIKNLHYSDPVNAYLFEKNELSAKKQKDRPCNKGYLFGLEAESVDRYDFSGPERCTREYEEMLRKSKEVKEKHNIIYCGNKVA